MTNTPDDTPGGGGSAAVSDEMLMAYADGELPPEQRVLVRKALTMDPALVQRLEDFIATKASLRRAFDPVLNAPIPERLLETVLGPTQGPAAPRPRASLAAPLFSRESVARLTERFRLPLAAVAAGVLLVAGWQLNNIVRVDLLAPDGRRLETSLKLQGALESTVTGASTRIESGEAVTPTLTFLSLEHGWCRQFQLAQPRGLRSMGMACRSEAGVWGIGLLTPATQPKRKPGPNESQIEFVGRDDILVDAAAQHIRDGDVLGAKDEALKIKEGWPKPKPR